jgi:hypothetical protein
MMTTIYVIQLVGLLLTVAGMIALAASSKLFGTRLDRSDRRRSERGGDTYQLPINWTTLASTTFFLGGIGILAWSKFNMCSFLNYWLPDLPDAVRIFLACR